MIDRLCSSAPQSALPERERHPGVKGKDWSLWEVMGKAILMEKQLEQLWWSGRCGVGVQPGEAGDCGELLPFLFAGWPGSVGSRMATERPQPEAEPPCRETGVTAEWSVAGVCACKKPSIHIYTHTCIKKKGRKKRDFDITSRNVTISLGTSHSDSFTKGMFKSTGGRKIMSHEFPAQWSMFDLFPKGKCRTFFFFFIIQVCKWEALRVRSVSPLLAAAYLENNFFSGGIYFYEWPQNNVVVLFCLELTLDAKWEL